MLYRFGQDDLNFGSLGFFQCEKKSKGRSKKKYKKKKSRRFGRKRSIRSSIRKSTKKGVKMVIEDPYEGLVKINRKIVKVPIRVIDELEKGTTSVIRAGDKIEILDPVNGVFKVSGEIV